MKRLTNLYLSLIIIASSIHIQASTLSYQNEFGENGNPKWALKGKDGHFGFVNRQGQTVVPYLYDSFGVFGAEGNEEWISATKNGKYGFINYKGAEVTKFIYDEIGIFGANGHEEWILAERNDKYGFINYKGVEVTSFIYDEIGIFGANGHEEWILVSKKGKYGFVNYEGLEVVPTEYDSFGIFGSSGYNEWIEAVKDGKYGFLNQNGGVAIPFEYANIYEIDKKYPGLLDGKTVKLADHTKDDENETTIVNDYYSLSEEEKEEIKKELQEAKKEIMEAFSGENMEEFSEVMSELGEGMNELLTPLLDAFSDMTYSVTESDKGRTNIKINKDLDNETLNRKETCPLSDFSELNISVALKSEDGNIKVKIYAPNKELIIDATASAYDMNINKTIEVRENNKKDYYGEWKVIIETKKASGNYSITMQGR